MSARQPRTKTRPRFARGVSRRARAAQAQPDPAQQPDPDPLPVAHESPQARERSAGGPDDRALYHCHCGYVFEADVSTTVGCPHCGTAQAW